MRFIDEKGRLFGKVNIIDFLVIVFLSSLIPVFYFGYRIFTKKPAVVTEKKEVIETEIYCKFIKIQPDIMKLISVGDKEFDENGSAIAEIILLGSISPYQYKIDMGNGEIKIITDSVLKELPAYLRLKAGIKDNRLYYKDKEIMINSPIEFRTPEYIAQAIPLPVPKEKEKFIEKWVRVKVKFSGVFPELATIINSGHMERDGEGKIIGVLKEVISNKPSEISALKLEENRLIYVNDPYRNDVIVSLDLLCTEQEGALYFKNYAVKIGNQIAFSSELYIISGMIIGIEKSEIRSSN